MERNFRACLRRQAGFIAGLALITLSLSGAWTGGAAAKEKVPAVSPDDPTLRLYQLLDGQYGGKLDGFCIIGDVFNDPKKPDHPEQHIFRVEYEKSRAFGRLRIYVRTVDKLTADQLKTYTPKQIYDYAETDSEKFTKTDPGYFGKTGDIYSLPVSEGGPLATAPITDEVRSAYERYVTNFLLPALQKK
jgi:hypothetical protein